MYIAFNDECNVKNDGGTNPLYFLGTYFRITRNGNARKGKNCRTNCSEMRCKPSYARYIVAISPTTSWGRCHFARCQAIRKNRTSSYRATMKRRLNSCRWYDGNKLRCLLVHIFSRSTLHHRKITSGFIDSVKYREFSESERYYAKRARFVILGVTI